MSGTIIPVTTSLVSWRQRTSIDGRDYLLDFLWNDRNGTWTISLSKEDGTPLRSGIPITLQRPLFPAPTLDMPRGTMVAIDLSNTSVEATLTDLGTRVILKYYSLEQIAEL